MNKIFTIIVKILYLRFMIITHIATGEKRKVVINSVKPEDFKVLTKKRYFFSWKLLKDKFDIYKLEIIGELDILGLVALKDVPEEYRIHVELLAVSSENMGNNKLFSGIAGALLGYACRKSLYKSDDLACVSLLPKTELREHYIHKYGMSDAGWQLYLEGKNLIDLMRKYGYA